MLASCQSLFFLRESLLSFEIGVLNFQCRAGTFLLWGGFQTKAHICSFLFFLGSEDLSVWMLYVFPDLGLLVWTDKVCILCLAPGTYLPCTNNPSEKMQQLSMIVCHSLCSPFYDANKEFIYVHILLRTCEQSKDSQELTGLCERSYQGQLLVPSKGLSRFEHIPFTFVTEPVISNVLIE